MNCKICLEDYSKEFDEDFINNECLPCRSQREFEESCLAEEKELQKFNKKNSTDYTGYGFYDACESLEITFEQLKGFPNLKSTWKYSDRIKKEITYYDKLRENKQFEIFEDMDLPF